MSRTVVPVPPAVAVQTASPTAFEPRYVVATVNSLPSFDISVILGAAFVCRGADVPFNAWLRKVASGCATGMHGVLFLGALVSCVMMCAQSKDLSTTLGLIALVPNLALAVFLLATLARDLVWLITKTFEFWFLTTLNSIGMAFCCMVLADQRMLAVFPTALMIQAIICQDASILIRRFLFRAAVVLPPGILFGTIPCVLRITPRLKISSLMLGNGHKVDSMDVVVHCYSSVAIFVAAKVIRSRYLVWPSREPIKTIHTQVIFPHCYLDSVGPTGQQSSKGEKSTEKCRLELVVDDLPGIVDTGDTVIEGQQLQRFAPWVALLGCVGTTSGGLAFGWYMAKVHTRDRPSALQIPLAILSFVTAVFCFVFYVAQAQRLLLRRLVWSLDGWFVSFQFTIVTIGVSDALYWDERVWFVWAAWVWCHWCMLDDTLVPTTRHRLVFHRFLTLLVHVTLLVYPMLLMYWVFYSGAPRLRNRVFFHTKIFESEVSMRAYSVLVSRIVTVWVWMARFLWRELFYPRDAFKLFKFRVQYHVPS